MNYNIGNKYNGFILEREEEIKEVNSIVRVFKHEKTEAKLLHMENEDKNKVFSIGFKTPPEDSTGVMHILEHSVLCGSENFPTKEPFVELAKGSLNTFLNAMTFSDKTVYPVASQNDKDFFNLMHVYLDAVFYPNIYNTKEILMQEGWHYHLENKEDELTYKGVVYNEMKGAFSSPDGVLMRKIQETLFPDNTYKNDSGGDPKDIPNLTYEQFIDTHKKYYHPSNSYIFLYGDCNIDEILKFIDNNYLSNYEKEAIDCDIPLQQPYTEIKDIEYSYSISEDENEKEKTYLSLNFVTGNSTDINIYMGLNILEYLLLETEGAPLKKALLDAEIGKDVYGSFDNSISQPVFSIIAKNSEPSKSNELKNIVKDCLTKLVKDGIDKKLIQGCINIFEFRLREADTGGYPKGLVYYFNAMDSWLYGGDPLTHIKYEESLEIVKKALTSNYFEELIEKYLLNNTHASLLTLKPEKNLSHKEDERVKEKLNNYKQQLSTEELDSIINETKKLNERQSTPDTEEALESIPLLSLEDIDKEIEKVELEELKYEDIKMLYHKENTNNIAYIDLMFNTHCVKEEDLAYVSLLSYLLGKVDTKNYSYKELSNEILINTGGFYCIHQAYINDKDIESYEPYLEVNTKVMDEKIPKAIELINEIIQLSCFEDKSRIRELIRSLISRIDMAIMQSGHQIAVDKLVSYFLPYGVYAEKTSGLDYYEFLKGIEENYDNEISKLSNKLEELKNTIFNKNNLTITLTSDDKELSTFKDNIKTVVDQLKTESTTKKEYSFVEENKNEGLMIPSDVNYVAKGYNFRKLNEEYNGSLLVLKTILGYDYLWNRVRVKGGAYGAMSNMTRTGNMVFVSYRDPNVEKTLKAYDEASDYLDKFNVNRREMTKYIIGTISNLDSPMSPMEKGKKAVTMHIRNISNDELQKERDEVLSTDVNKIKSYSKILNNVMDKNYIAVVGNEKKIKENKNLFKEVINVFK